MEKFLPKLVNADLHLPEEMDYEFDMMWDALEWDIHWREITSTPIDLDVKDIKALLTRGHDLSLIKVDLPAVKHWEIDAI